MSKLQEKPSSLKKRTSSTSWIRIRIRIHNTEKSYSNSNLFSDSSGKQILSPSPCEAGKSPHCCVKYDVKKAHWPFQGPTAVINVVLCFSKVCPDKLETVLWIRNDFFLIRSRLRIRLFREFRIRSYSGSCMNLL